MNKNNYAWIVLLDERDEVPVIARRHYVTEEGVLKFDAWLPDGEMETSQSFAAGTWRSVKLAAPALS